MAETGYSRAHLRARALEKQADAELLFENGRYSSSYYLYGYVVECALKACISRKFEPETIPDPAFVRKIYTHSFDELVGLADLRGNLRIRNEQDPEFYANWSAVLEWKESVRYLAVERPRADTIRNAVSDREHGVLEWLKQSW
jgi:hypothetical protein